MEIKELPHHYEIVIKCRDNLEYLHALTIVVAINKLIENNLEELNRIRRFR